MTCSARLALRAEAAAWLVVAWLTLDVLPWKLYRKLLPSAAVGNGSMADRETSILQNVVAKRIGLVVDDTSRRIPIRSVCFHRGIAALRMLDRRKLQATLHYGVAHVPGRQSLRAHVWVTSCGHDVTGGFVKKEFQEIAHFPASALHTHFRADRELNG